MIEEWRDTPYPGYRVSSLGRVQGKSGRIIQGSLNTVTRYRSISPYGQELRLHIHVLVCEAFHGPRPTGMEVRHLDGDRGNNAASNLTWGTRSQNNKDATDQGKRLLTREQVRNIRSDYATGLHTHKTLACIYRVHKSTIQAVLTGRQYVE